MITFISDKFKMPRKKRLTQKVITIIVIMTLAVSWMIAWDRTKGNQIRLDKAVQLMSDKQYDESLRLYNKVLKRWPRSKLALTGKGLCELNLRQYEEALASYDKILSLDPDNLQGLQGKGMSYEKLGRLDDAIRCYQRIQELKPEVLHAKEHVARLRRLKAIIQ